MALKWPTEKNSTVAL